MRNSGSTTKSLLLLALFAYIAMADPLDSAKQNYNIFKDWASQHGKQYGVDETPIRYAAWKNTYDAIQEHNAKNLSWELGLNQFSDMSPEEFSALHLGYNWPSSSSSSSFPGFPNFPNFPNNFPDFPNNLPVNPNNNNNGGNGGNGGNSGSDAAVIAMLMKVNVSASLDWRDKNVLTPIKDQGSCGACWSFSSTGALEALYALNKSQVVSFSEQQLIDCTKSSTYGNNGCNGGLMTPTFQYTASNGIELESDYPFTGNDGTCQYSSSKVAFKNTGYISVPANNATLLKHAVSLQPVSVAIEADQTAFQSYKSGIISSNCGTNLDHAVLAIGYNSSNGVDYWIIKNQWGTTWGINGYAYIAAGQQNSGSGVCGINMDASFPTL